MIDLFRINSCLSNLYRQALSVLAFQVIQLLPLLDFPDVQELAIHLQPQILGLVILVLVWGSAAKHGRWLVQRRLEWMSSSLYFVQYRFPCMTRNDKRKAYVIIKHCPQKKWSLQAALLAKALITTSPGLSLKMFMTPVYLGGGPPYDEGWLRVYAGNPGLLHESK